MLKMLNEDMFEAVVADFFVHIFEKFAANNIYPNEKEKYLLTSLPNVHLARSGLVAYECREAFGFLNSTLAFTMETAEFPVDFFNEYTLTMRGRAS